MKKLIPAILILALAVSGCSTKFNVAAPYKNITVVYGLLDEIDTAHYIRIQKAFLDDSKSALAMAQVPDSNFYSNLNVKIERIDAFNSGTIFDTIHLNLVDLNQEGYPKQSGVFFNSPNYAYKFKSVLVPYYTYRLVITNKTTGQSDSSETAIIDDNNTSSFSVPVIDDIVYNLNGLDFSSSYNNFNLIATYNDPVANFSFENQSTPIAISQLIIRFNWLDSNTLTHAVSGHSYDYNAGYTTPTGGSSFTFQIANTSLYSAVASGLGTAPANTQRFLEKCDIFVYLGTFDFSNYQQTTSIQGTGLTANEIEPIYTNIKGANALGLYTSRGTRTGKIAITRTTIDSLQSNATTSGVNIVGSR
jgi:hypothetical protein